MFGTALERPQAESILQQLAGNFSNTPPHLFEMIVRCLLLMVPHLFPGTKLPFQCAHGRTSIVPLVQGIGMNAKSSPQLGVQEGFAATCINDDLLIDIEKIATKRHRLKSLEV